MRRRKNIWEQIQEMSSEGPTVTVTIPRDFAEELLRSLAASLEQDMPGDEDGDDISGDIDLDSIDDLDGGMDDLAGPPEDEMDLDFMPAGDDDDEEDAGPPTAAGKKGPGRPPGAKNKGKKDDDDDGDKEDDDDEKDESIGDPRPQTALGESAFFKLSRGLTRRPAVRTRR